MKRSLDDWKAIIAEQTASGKSVVTFCRERGLNENRFYWCRKKLQTCNGKYAALKPAGSAPVTIELEGLKLLVAIDQLQAVLNVLCD